MQIPETMPTSKAAKNLKRKLRAQKERAAKAQAEVQADARSDIGFAYFMENKRASLRAALEARSCAKFFKLCEELEEAVRSCAKKRL